MKKTQDLMKQTKVEIDINNHTEYEDIECKNDIYNILDHEEKSQNNGNKEVNKSDNQKWR